VARQKVQKRARPIKAAKRQKKFLGLALMAVVLVLSFAYQAWTAEWFSDDLKVWFFDVGQGDAIFIETPDHQQILVDTGNPRVVLAKLGAVMLPWDRYIDAVIITHPHADHEGGLPEILKRYNVGVIYKTGVLGTYDLQQTVEDLVEAKGTPIEYVWASSSPPLPDATEGEGLGVRDRMSHIERWPVGEGVVLQILAPSTNPYNKKIDDLNSASIVLLLTYGDTSILLTGDATIEEEPEFLSSLEHIDVLKVAHHGSVTSSSREFLEITTPDAAIISVGEGNDYNHPHPAVLERLNSYGIKTLRTDFEGDILITSDGGEPIVESRSLPF
jgi:competence protein ComEC